MALILLPLAHRELFAQPAWYGPPQYGGYAPNGAYSPGPYPPTGAYGQYSRPAYSQAQPYPQQQYPQQPYAQPQQYAQPQSYEQTSPQEQADNGPPYADLDQDYGPSQPPSQSFTAEQLEQMLAPIALYPDALVAQILAAATYPAQVSLADQWLRSMGNAPPQQIAAQADAQNWDPSVKALTAFPQVVAMMDHDLSWTTDVGNAYYNQPQDVLQTVQVLRQRAQAAGTLQNTPQEQVTYDQGNIDLSPPDPNTVYVPQYNPWNVYGDPIQPYPGFSLLDSIGSVAGSVLGSSPLQYGLGIAMAAFTNTPFGWLSWALDWLGNSVLFNHSPYYSESLSVAHWGGERWGGRGGREWAGGYGRHDGYGRDNFDRGWYGNRYNRGGFDHIGSYRDRYGRGDNGRQGYGNQERAYGRTPENYGGRGNGFVGDRNRGFATQPGFESRPQYGNRYGRENGGYVRPAMPEQAYSRPGERPMPARTQPMFEQRPYSPQSPVRSPYGSGFMGGGRSDFGNRSGTYYGGSQPAWRAQAPQQHSFAPHGGFGQPAYSSPHSSFFGRGNSGPSYKPPRSGGGFHLFGGGHSSPHYSAPKAPKSFGGGGHWGGGGHSGGGGGHSSGHGGGWGHHH